MAGLFEIDSNESDGGGLAKLPNGTRSPDTAVQWLTGSGSTDMELTNITDFVNSFASRREIEERLEAADLAAFKDNTRLLNQTVARTRHASRSAYTP